MMPRQKPQQKTTAVSNNKDAERVKAVEAEMTRMTTEIQGLRDQLLKAEATADELKTVAENCQKREQQAKEKYVMREKESQGIDAKFAELQTKESPVAEGAKLKAEREAALCSAKKLEGQIDEMTATLNKVKAQEKTAAKKLSEKTSQWQSEQTRYGKLFREMTDVKEQLEKTLLEKKKLSEQIAAERKKWNQEKPVVKLSPKRSRPSKPIIIDNTGFLTKRIPLEDANKRECALAGVTLIFAMLFSYFFVR